MVFDALFVLGQCRDGAFEDIARDVIERTRVQPADYGPHLEVRNGQSFVCKILATAARE